MTWDVPGQEHAVGVLRGAVERGEVSHALAFIGPPGVGQESAARWLMAGLNCRGGDGLITESPPCGYCQVCDQALRGAHSAQHEFEPLGGSYLKEDVLDNWLKTAFLSAGDGEWKVLRILEADRMHPVAANTFLKGLEEPPERTVWVLDIAEPDDLPDTILSRCQVVRFQPLSHELLDVEAARLGLADPVDRALAVRASFGSPSALRRFAEAGGLAAYRSHRSIPGRLRTTGSATALVEAKRIDDEVKQRSAAVKEAGKEALDTLNSDWDKKPPKGAVTALEERQKRVERAVKIQTIAYALDDVLGWYRDCLFVGNGGDPAAAINADAPAELVADAESLGPARLLRAADMVMATRDTLVFNAAQPLTLETLFMQLSADR